MKPSILLLLGLISIGTTVRARALDIPTKEDHRLIPVYHADRVWNAVTTTADGRVFVGFPSADRPGVQLMEMDGPGRGHAYPNKIWNSWKPGGAIGVAFVHVNAIRIGPDGKLWVIDAGSPGLGQTAVRGAARAIRINLATDRVDRIYRLTSAVKSASYIDDIRFNGPYAYLTDAGAPALLVLDLKSGAVRRVLERTATVTDQRAMRADGRILRDKHGKELRMHADQLEVSPDGRWFYYQPCSGPLARIETRWLDDPSISAADLAKHAKIWIDTPTSGGTAIDSDGNIYYGDAENRSILKITPDGSVSTLIADPRLIWSDAMWIDRKGFLWIPATQQNLTPGFNSGKMAVHYPVWIYKMQIHAKPPMLDHP